MPAARRLRHGAHFVDSAAMKARSSAGPSPRGSKPGRAGSRRDAAGIAALAWQGGSGCAMVVANLTSEPRRIVLPGASQGHILDLTQVASAARDPHWLHSPGETFAALDLGAYACALLAAGAAQASVE